MWQQYALSLLAAGRPERALFVLEEAVRLNPGQSALLLLAARTCYQSLHRVRPPTHSDKGHSDSKPATRACTG